MYSLGSKASFLVIILLVLLVGIVDGPDAPESPPGFWDSVYNMFKSVWDAVTRFFAWLWDSLNTLFTFFGDVASTVFSFLKVLKDGISTIVEVFGKPGDPGLWFSIQTRLAMYRLYVVDPDLREKVDRVLSGNCSVKLKELRDVLTEIDSKDDRTVCDVQPTGFLGFLSFTFFTITRSWTVVSWILKNFVIVHMLLLGGTLMLACASAFSSKSMEPIERWARGWGSYFMLYIKFGNWLLERLMSLIQTIAEALPL